MINSNKRIVCVIPARLQSSRFPKKILVNLLDKPLLQWVWDAAHKVPMFDEIVFAIDSQEAADLIQSFGGKYIMTSEKCESGTARLVEIMQSGKIQADIWVNWQGDEPFITTEMIYDLLQPCDNTSGMCTLKKLITIEEQITSPNIAKVVSDAHQYALYFSRSPVPYFRDEKDLKVVLDKKIYYKHVGIYAFSTDALQKIAKLGFSELEDAEKLEQLRLLHYNIPVKVHETNHEVMGIDTPEDLRRAEIRAKQAYQTL